MKKSIFQLMSLLIVTTLLAACSGQGLPAILGSGSASSGTGVPGEEGQTTEISDSIQLAVGILKLEDSDQAITAEEAQALLPLWKAVKSLASSDTVTDAEFNALFDQIREGLTADQVQAIAAMDVQQADLQSLMQEFGVQMGRNTAGSTGDTTGSSNGGFPAEGFAPGGEGGGMPAGGGGGGGMPAGGGGGMPAGGGGGFPGGGGGDFGGGGFAGNGSQGATDAESATQAASRLQTMARASNPFVDAVIQLLEERAGVKA
ncbi:MAG: hypothetical protein VB089_15440 [Anaerolineaceae bacterium]|jgi:hypothetical protein|nr:hypothetical protein [Anaerolineaceae bacterium]